MLPSNSSGNNRIRMVDFATKKISTVAGDGFAMSAGDLGQAVTASLRRPVGLAILEVPDGRVPGGVRRSLYISERGGNCIRRVLLTPFIVGPTPMPSHTPTAPTTRPTKLPSER